MNTFHLGEREGFDDYRKYLDNKDWIGNLLEHFQLPITSITSTL
jgi:hypothetical protein